MVLAISYLYLQFPFCKVDSITGTSVRGVQDDVLNAHLARPLPGFSMAAHLTIWVDNSLLWDCLVWYEMCGSILSLYSLDSRSPS